MDCTEFRNREELETIVPHKGKMMLLSRVKSFDLEELLIVTEVDVSDASMFYDEELGGVPVWVSFEYMAQSISALSGIYGRLNNQSPKVGFIMSVTNFNGKVSAFGPGQTLVVKVRQLLRVDMAVTFEGSVFLDGAEVVCATLNTVEVEDPKQALNRP